MLNKRGTRAPTLNTNKIFLPKSKRSQLTIFIIIAILIVAGVVLFFILKGNPKPIETSTTFQEIEKTFLSRESRKTCKTHVLF